MKILNSKDKLISSTDNIDNYTCYNYMKRMSNNQHPESNTQKRKRKRIPNFTYLNTYHI